jgi:hypothetical protein
MKSRWSRCSRATANAFASLDAHGQLASTHVAGPLAPRLGDDPNGRLQTISPLAPRI